MTQLDPITLEVFANRFSSIAQEMGVTLRRTGCSPNIKERCDYSCALFDQNGEMVAQAAHIPVHLGSMPLSTKAAIERVEMKVGDAVILNDPYLGGTHLPDITIVSPVFLPGEEQPRFYVANRAHHADIGGVTPGSMPLSRHIDEEGVRIAPTKILENGKIVDSFMKDFLSKVRTPEEREGDIAAQLAANHVGIQRLLSLCSENGTASVCRASDGLLSYAEKITRNVIDQIPPGTYSFGDVIEDDGVGTKNIPIHVTVKVPGDQTLVADFSESSIQVPGCINAVYAITLSACFYVLRCLVPFDIPANGGVARPLRLIAPEGSVVNAREPAAVAAGNVETSQRIVDVLLGALSKALPDRIPAASCGSMNNLALGGKDPETGKNFSYYETIGGGCGAGPHWQGASGVHTHMTNSLNTPVEALEHEYPLRVRHYGIRGNSGGRGRYRGGDGVERQVEFLTSATATLISERRERPPWGLFGGEPGVCGENTVLRCGQKKPEALGGKVSLEMNPGDVLIIKTPGGGGFGIEE